MNPEWNQAFAVKIPGSRGDLVLEVYDHDVFGSNDLIGTAQLDIGPLKIEDTSTHCLTLCPAAGKAEDSRLGKVTFTLKVAPYDESKAEKGFEGRRKGDKKVIGTVILRLCSANDIRPAPAAKKGPEK